MPGGPKKDGEELSGLLGRKYSHRVSVAAVGPWTLVPRGYGSSVPSR